MNDLSKLEKAQHLRDQLQQKTNLKKVTKETKRVKIGLMNRLGNTDERFAQVRKRTQYLRDPLQWCSAVLCCEVENVSKTMKRIRKGFGNKLGKSDERFAQVNKRIGYMCIKLRVRGVAEDRGSKARARGKGEADTGRAGRQAVRRRAVPGGRSAGELRPH